MRRGLTLLSILLLGVSSLCAQLSKVTKIPINVNWDKTTHLIFPTNIKYFKSVNDFIVADNREDTPTILSVKANEKDFEGKSNLSVATADGKFYTFEVGYVQNLQETSLFLKNDSIIIPERIGINMLNNAHLIFPNPVKYIDFGSDAINAVSAENLQNVVRVAALEKFDFDTNLSVATASGKFYTFDLYYDDKETNYTYQIGENIDSNSPQALLKQEDLTDDDREEIVKKIKDKGRTIHTMGIRKNKVEFAIHNIFVRNNKIVFRIELKNNSNIKYDIDYIKFPIRDKKTNKKTASQDDEQQPLFIDNFSPLIEGKSNNIFSVCFEKFTIPDNKNFIIEINEKNGGRHIIYKLDNKEIINAESL